MEFVASRSLQDVITRDGPLTHRRAARIGLAVLDALRAAHLAGVLQRDVKPHNVLIADDGRVVLTDFGLATVAALAADRTEPLLGSPHYIAPERLSDGVSSEQSDLWSLGATLYAAVEGAPPFGLDDNAYALLHKVATEAPQVPEHAGPLTPVLKRLLAVDPAARPSASQARDLLTAVAAGETVPEAPSPTGTAVIGAVRPSGPSTRPDLVPPPSAAPAPAPQRRRAPVLVGAVVALLAIGGGATALALAGGGQAPAATPPATTAAPAAAAPTSAAPTSAAAPTTAPTPTTSPVVTGNPIAFVQRYYALLPSDPDAAFALLGPTAQSQSGGRAAFTNFYGTVAQVAVEDARATGDNTVSATVRFVLKDGRVTREPYRFVISTAADGSQLMEQFDRA